MHFIHVRHYEVSYTESQKVNGAISTLRLNALLHLHLAPINQIVFLGPNIGKSNLEASFALNMLSALIYSEL